MEVSSNSCPSHDSPRPPTHLAPCNNTSPVTHSPFLALPPEIRYQIYTILFSQASTLTLRSLFIRTNYRNTFMTQQPKNLHPHILLVCQQITHEAIAVLYSLPTWHAPCRLSALSNQIGQTNLSHIKTLTIDVDDLDILVESCHKHYQEPRQPQPSSILSPSPELTFTSLTTLSLEGYQSSALSSRGTHRTRLEALRLLALATSLLSTHPNLKTLLQRPPKYTGADAQDLTLGRVRWRFTCPHRHRRALQAHRAEFNHEDDEHVVDIHLVRSILEYILREEESVNQKIRESSLPVAWTSSPGGRFCLYPYLARNVAAAGLGYGRGGG